MTPEVKREWMNLFALAAPVSRDIVNAAEAFHESEAIQSLALIGAAVAITRHCGAVGRDEFLTACAIAWDTQTAEFETVERKAN